LLAGEEIGTLFVAKGQRRSGRDRWIAAARPLGTIVIDDGAIKALAEKNKSLLPAGIVSVEGEFVRGDIVTIAGSDGRSIARGLSNYSSEEIKLVRGKKTAEVRLLMKDNSYDEVVHRNNLVME
jgi:glutamate 5-kinase